MIDVASPAARAEAAEAWRRWRAPSFLGLIAVLQVLRVLCTLPPHVLASPDPLRVNALGHAYLEARRMDRFAAAGVGLSGYDPLFLGGAPQEARLAVDAISLARMARALEPRVALGRGIKIAAFSCLFFPPFMLYAAAFLYRRRHEDGLVAALLAAGGQGNHDPYSALLMWRGYVSFMAAGSLGVFAAACFHRAVMDHRRIWWMAAFGATIVAGFLNALLWPPLAILGWVAVIVAWRRRESGAAVGAAGLAVLLIAMAPTLRAYLLFSGDQVAFGPVPWDLWLAPFREWHLFHNGVVIIRVGVVALAVAALGGLSEQRRNWAIGWLGCIEAMFMASPNIPWMSGAVSERWVWLFFVSLVPFAAFAFVDGVRRWGVPAGLVGGAFLWYGATWQIVLPEALPQIADVQTDTDRVAARLERLTDAHRFLVEPRLIDIDEHGFLADRLGKPVLGGGTHAPVRYLWTTGMTGPGERPMLFERPLDEWDEPSLRRALNRLGVSHVVVYTLQAKSRFDRYPALFRKLPFADEQSDRRRRGLGYPTPPDPHRAALYEVVGHSDSDVLKGGGQVDAGPNRLVLRKAPAGAVTLKYQWCSELDAPPGVVVRPVRIDRDLLLIGVVSDGSTDPIVIRGRYF